MAVTRYHLVLLATAVALVVICLTASGWGLWLALSLALGLAGLTVGLGVSFPHWQLFGPSLCRVQTQRPAVALTFDDGPDAENTPALLDLLKRHQVRATFFVVGERAARHTELVRRMFAEGHQIENHTQTHGRWTNLLGVCQLRREIEQAQQVIRQLTGRAPVCFRTPAGLTNPRVFQVSRALRLTVVGYTARGRDQSPVSADRVVARLESGVRHGGILLLHDSGVPRERLLQTVEMLLDRVRSGGYECLRLDELIRLEGK